MPRGLRLALFVVSLFGTAASAQQVTFTPLHASGIYNAGEPVGWKVSGPAGASYTYTIKRNNSDVIRTGKLDLASGSATIQATLDEPGMIYVTIDADPVPADQKPDTHFATLGAAIAPTKLAPSVPRPKDFDAFWSSKLKLLKKIPINPALTPTPTDKDGVELYTVKLDSVDSHVQGYLAKPKREGKFPALVLFQYAGVYALKTSWATEHAAEGWLTFDVDSHDIPPSEGTGVAKEYQNIGSNDREKSYFLDMYLRDTRAIDYIASRPDWDGRTIVLMGASMGGQQSLVTAGLNPERITAVLVNEPSGADSNGDLHGRRAGYPRWLSTDPQVMKTALYFDTVNFASRIKAPTLAAMGFIDTTSPPVGIWIDLNQIAGAKEAVPMIESDHNNRTPEKQGAYNDRSKELLNVLLHGGTFVPNAAPSRP